MMPSYTISSTLTLVAHALALSWLVMSAPLKPDFKAKQKLVVKTVSLNSFTPTQPVENKTEERVAALEKEMVPEPKVKEKAKAESKAKEELKAESKAKEEPKLEPKVKEKAKAKSKPKPKPEKKVKEAPKANPKAKKVVASKEETKKVSSKKQELLAKAKRSIAKIEQPHVKMGSNQSSTKAKVGTLQLETLSSEEMGYRDQLAERLQRDLKLPEEGDIDLKLTLSRAGKVIKIVVTKAKSEKNKSYLEQSLKDLSFPGYGNYFSAAQEYTFLLTLTN